MGVTDELRKWAKQNQSHSDVFLGLPLKHPFNRCCAVEDLLTIADHIDRAHKVAVDKAHADGERNGLQQARSASEDWRRGFDAGRAERMEENGWVKLPVDADGVPIRIGDKVTEHEDGHTFKVGGFMDWGGEWWVFMCDGIQAPASRCTHYHEPTVADVLEEYLAEREELGDRDYCVDDDARAAWDRELAELNAEYAERLQLREVDA